MVCKLRDKKTDGIDKKKKHLEIVLHPELIPSFVQGSKYRTGNHTLFSRGSRGNLDKSVTENSQV